mgnify:CR=1 FL=1
MNATISRLDDRKALRLGTDLSGVTDIQQALTQANLDWGLNVIPADHLAILGDDGITPTSIPGMRLVMRDDNHVTLGVVGGKYQAVDNRSVFSMGEHVLAQGGHLIAGGEVDHGRKTFMRFSLPEAQIKVGGKDLVNFGVTIRAAHDGTGHVFAGVEATRLVCTNGMTTKIKGIPHEFKLRHTASAEGRLAEAEQVLQGAARYAREFVAAADVMLDTKFTLREYETYIDALFPKPEEEGRARTLWETRRGELLDLYQFAETNDLGRNTAWGAFNSVTEYLDWAAPVRVTTGSTVEDTRARRQFDNSNQAVKDQAFSLLVSA